MTVCPQVLAVSGKRLGAALPSALQRERSLFDLWSAGRRSPRKPRRFGTPGPGPVLLETPCPHDAAGAWTPSPSVLLLLKLWPR